MKKATQKFKSFNDGIESIFFSCVFVKLELAVEFFFRKLKKVK
jgi:hypothetical protein